MSFDSVPTKVAVSAPPSIVAGRLLSAPGNTDVPRSRAAWVACFVSTLTIALVCTAFAEIAFAQETGKVVEFGIYSDDRKLLETTTIIPIKDGVRFGFCFEADIDFYEDSYMLVESLTHPPIAVRDSGEDSGYSVPRMFAVRDGVARGCSGYRARDVSDLRPGVWKFTISDGEEVLVEQEFSVR